jgi:hypothetical protein
VLAAADHQDHTFCGVMFPIEIKQGLPIEKVTILTLSVRGSLGPMTVWVSGADVTDKADDQVVHYGGRTWYLIYRAFHQPSFRQYTPLEISPISLKPGESCDIYIHSSLNSDRAIVYDNAHKLCTFSDDVVHVSAGRAHLSTTPFGTRNVWGYSGAWRDNRAFVGQIQYGVVYKLWNPQIHKDFGNAFDQMVMTLLLCQRQTESPISMLPDDCLYYILNMCGYSWAAPCAGKKSRKNKRSKQRPRETKSLVWKLLHPVSSWRN